MADDKNITTSEQVLLDMANETRAPLTEEELELSRQIQAIKDKGRTVEIPPEIL